ncbi:CG17237 [Drosophila busckii]|uniref:CG17237 n=1 Tax=Drosophila busckii TaxID=30019 RepID=A0A0M4EDY5_DROBS|nr:myosin-2 essential light chain [Drosophila busckii]ALC40147.1 CG17237 [Drosophila busckii]
MASQCSAEQLQKILWTFLQYDLRGDGKLELSQLGDCLRVLERNPSEASIRQHIQKLRASNAAIARISFDEFLPILESYPAIAATSTDEAAQFIDSLRMFDEQGTGYLPAGKLRRILASCGEPLSKHELDELLSNRINAQGLVNYVELIHAIIKS